MCLVVFLVSFIVLFSKSLLASSIICLDQDLAAVRKRDASEVWKAELALDFLCVCLPIVAFIFN